jgi:hypothetical protein
LIFSPSACPVAAQLVRDALPLRLHPAVNVGGNLRHEVDALQANVHDGDPDPAHVLVDLFGHGAHDLLALAGHHVVHGALRELRAERIVHRLRDARFRRERVAAHRTVVLAHVDDPPLHERIDEDVAVLGGEEALRIARFHRLDARVVEADVLQHRDHEVQARVRLHGDDFAELELDRGLALVDGVHAHREDDRRDDGGDEDRSGGAFHRPASLSRERRPSRRGCCGSVVTAGAGVVSAGAGRGASIVVEEPVICMMRSSGR